MEFPILNKFEKEKKVIELHKQGKTLKEIATIIHMSFRDISKIIKVYERKIRLQAKKGEINHSSQIKKYRKVVKLLSYLVKVKNLLGSY